MKTNIQLHNTQLSLKQTPEILKRPLLFISNTPGIYLFTWIHNPNVCYLGSSIHLRTRIKAHITQCNAGTHRHPKFYNKVRSVGWYSFEVHILEFVDNKSILLEREQAWLDLMFKDSVLLQTTQNLATKAESSQGVKHSLETRLKYSLSKKGKPLSEEHRLNISLGKRGSLHHYFGQKRNPETTAQMRESLKKSQGKFKWIPIHFCDLEGIIIGSFDSVTEAANCQGCSGNKIHNYLDRNKLYDKKFFIRRNTIDKF